MPYIIEDYVAARTALDYPNAKLIWDALAEAYCSFLRRQSKDLVSPAPPTILPAFKPNSGGEILVRRMEDALG